MNHAKKNLYTVSDKVFRAYTKWQHLDQHCKRGVEQKIFSGFYFCQSHFDSGKKIKEQFVLGMIFLFKLFLWRAIYLPSYYFIFEHLTMKVTNV